MNIIGSGIKSQVLDLKTLPISSPLKISVKYVLRSFYKSLMKFWP